MREHDRRMCRHAVGVFLAVVLLTTLSLTMAAAMNLDTGLRRTVTDIPVTAVLKPGAAPESVSLLRRELKRTPCISAARFIPPSQALERLDRESVEKTAPDTGAVSAGELPAAFELVVARAADVEALARRLRSLEVVQTVLYDPQAVEERLQEASVLRTFGTVLAALIMVALFIAILACLPRGGGGRARPAVSIVNGLTMVLVAGLIAAITYEASVLPYAAGACPGLELLPAGAVLGPCLATVLLVTSVCVLARAVARPRAVIGAEVPAPVEGAPRPVALSDARP